MLQRPAYFGDAGTGRSISIRGDDVSHIAVSYSYPSFETVRELTTLYSFGSLNTYGSRAVVIDLIMAMPI